MPKKVSQIQEYCEKKKELDRKAAQEEYRLKMWEWSASLVQATANIAEGNKKLGKADKLRFLNISQSSLEECRYYIILSQDLHYISKEDADLLNYKIEGASWYLNAYINGIINNSGIKD